MDARARERGQATPEWLALVLLVALAFVSLAAAGIRLPGLDVGALIAKRLVCGAGIGSDCGDESEIEVAFGPELAALVTDHAPRLEYERGMRALPVDYRSCREDACAEGAALGPVARSLAGEPVTAFVHVVDCREGALERPAEADCSGARAGRIYLQYWLYYPGSATRAWGDAGFHPDDFESFQVRIDPDGRIDARASSHHSYNGRSGGWLSDAGVARRAGWTESTGRYFIAGGSHAGRVGDGEGILRWTDPQAIRLVPIEAIDSRDRGIDFAITPPWEKDVFRDPESEGTA